MESDAHAIQIQNQLNAFQLFMLLSTQSIFFILLMHCLYPGDEAPKMRMRKLGKDISRTLQTGETIRPVTRLTVHEIALLTRHERLSPCVERDYRLTDEDQMIMMVLRDGEANFLREKAEIFTDPIMNYGSLIMKRASVDCEKGKSVRELIETAGEARVENLVPLKRTKGLDKKKKKKERLDALDQLTRGESAERLNIFTRIRPDRAGTSRKVIKMKSTMDATVEDADKTLQRKKLRPTKGFRNLVINEINTPVGVGISEKESLAVAAAAMKKKKSVMIKTLEEQSTLQVQKTPEDLTTKKSVVFH